MGMRSVTGIGAAETAASRRPANSEAQAPLAVARGFFGDEDSWTRETHGLRTEYAVIYPPNHLAPFIALARRQPQATRVACPRDWSFPRLHWRNRNRPGTATDPVAHDADHERWLLIPGLSADPSLQHIAQDSLARLFGRQVAVLDAAVDALPPRYDGGLGELAIEDAVCTLFPRLVAALVETAPLGRVILLGHSRGTLLVAVMLKLLEALLTRPGVEPHARSLVPMDASHSPPESLIAQRLIASGRCALPGARGGWTPSLRDLARMEVYCFANAVPSMGPMAVPGGYSPIPWIESFANELDPLAVPAHPPGDADGNPRRVTGERYVRPGARGHFLCAHYLAGIAADLGHSEDGRRSPELVPQRGNRARVPRLYGYAGGQTPPPPLAGLPGGHHG